MAGWVVVGMRIASWCLEAQRALLSWSTGARVSGSQERVGIDFGGKRARMDLVGRALSLRGRVRERGLGKVRDKERDFQSRGGL